MRKKLFEGALILLLGLSAFAANVVAPTKSELEAIYKVAAQELNGGRYSEALKQLDAIDARQPDMAAAKNLRGVALMRMGDYGVAEKALQKARELDPALWEARFNLAEIPFLKKNWVEARHRFEKLGAGKSEQAEGATGDLIQFKILLTYLLDGKEKKALEILDRLQASSASPAYYYGKAALSFRHRDEVEAKLALEAAEKSFSPRLYKLFLESFYEVGWMKKPEGAVPAALQVASLADRAARAQELFAKAEQVYRQRDFEGAWQFLDQVDATVPNQASSYNLRGEILLAQGKVDEAEAAWRSALAANPQLLDARCNLARIPFKKRDYATARKQLEAILGATSGGHRQRQREQLIRFQIFLTLLLEGRDGPAQKAMEDFKMMDDTPALYYAQAAWAFQHGDAARGNVWVANAGNLYPDDVNQEFAAAFADLGWVGHGGAPLTAQQAPPLTGPTPAFRAAAVPRGELPDAPVLVPSIPEMSDAPFEFTFAPGTPSVGSSDLFLAQIAEPAASPTPEVSPPAASVAVEQRTGSRKGAAVRKKKNRKARADADEARAEAAQRPASPTLPTPSATPAQPAVAERPHQNFGDKVARLLSRPFQRRKVPAPTPVENSKTASPQPSRPKN